MSKTNNKRQRQSASAETIKPAFEVETTAPIRGMSIFSLASGCTPPPINHAETRFCSGANIPSLSTPRRHSDPCATFNNKRPHINDEPSTPSPSASPAEGEHFSVAEAIKTAPLLYLRPIEETPPIADTQKQKDNPAPAQKRPHVKGIFNGALNNPKKGVPIVTMPQTYDLEQLSTWHKEREGHEPEPTSVTPIWLKQENGSWARVSNTTWHQLFEPLLRRLDMLKQELATLRERQLAGWSHEGASPS